MVAQLLWLSNSLLLWVLCDQGLWPCCRHGQDVNQLLVDIGMVLQYHQHLLEAGNSSVSDGVNDITADWDSAWAENGVLSSQDSDGSEFPGSDNSTHCGVLSAAASAAAHSNAGSMTYMSDDDATSEAEHGTYIQTHGIGSPSEGLMEGLWRSGSGVLRGPTGVGYAPFTHPVYVSHMVQTAQSLRRLCQEEGDLPALLDQVGLLVLCSIHAVMERTSMALSTNKSVCWQARTAS